MAEAMKGVQLIMPPDVTVELRLGQLFADCAASVYGVPSPVPRIIEHTATWSVGDFHIIFNSQSNQLYIAGDLWDVVFESAQQRIEFGGKVEDSPNTGKILVGRAELLTLIVAALRITRHERESYESIYPE